MILKSSNLLSFICSPSVPTYCCRATNIVVPFDEWQAFNQLGVTYPFREKVLLSTNKEFTNFLNELAFLQYRYAYEAQLIKQSCALVIPYGLTQKELNSYNALSLDILKELYSAFRHQCKMPEITEPMTMETRALIMRSLEYNTEEDL